MVYTRRVRVAYCASPSRLSLARTPSVSPRRTIGIGDGARVLFHRGALPPREPRRAWREATLRTRVSVDSLKTRLL